MKDQKNDSNSALARFGRDKRTRTVTAEGERFERRPRSQRDAADSEHKSNFRGDAARPRRASFNPNFTEDNRPKFGGDREGGRPEGRSFGDRGRKFGDRRFGGDRDRSFGEDRERRFGGDRDRKVGADRDRRPSYGDRRSDDRKPFAGKGFGRKQEEYATYEEFDRERNERGSRSFERKSGGRNGAHDRRFADRQSDDRRGSRNYRKNDERPSYPKYNPERQTGAMRLNRFIAQSGICSRREADDFILAGVVSVNGQIVSELGTKVMPTDVVKFNDSRVQGEKLVYLVLNKPKGYVTSLEDPHADKTVMDLVRGACTERIYPVGRLDKNSLGLLLFTNDGDLTKQLTHPSYAKKKIYQVLLDKPFTRADMDRMTEGMTLEDGEIYADEVSYVSEDKKEIGIEIHSGRNRIVRRMCEFLGYEVKKLDRVYYAGLTKKNLKRGQWRFLSDVEVNRLKSGLYE